MPKSTTTRSASFGPLTVEFDERVLTPRTWTFRQSEWAAELAAGAPGGPLLELCAGAGHIGLAAAVLADRDLVQVERDPVAASFARGNATRAGRADRVEVRVSPLETALRPGERFPIVLADPPYLPSAQIQRWPEDPSTAIDGGPDGLTVVRAVLAVAADHLEPGGLLLLQVAGPPQVEAVCALLRRSADAIPVTPPLRPVENRVIDGERAVMLLVRE